MLRCCPSLQASFPLLKGCKLKLKCKNNRKKKNASFKSPSKFQAAERFLMHVNKSHKQSLFQQKVRRRGHSTLLPLLSANCADGSMWFSLEFSVICTCLLSRRLILTRPCSWEVSIICPSPLATSGWFILFCLSSWCRIFGALFPSSCWMFLPGAGPLSSLPVLECTGPVSKWLAFIGAILLSCCLLQMGVLLACRGRV